MAAHTGEASLGQAQRIAVASVALLTLYGALACSAGDPGFLFGDSATAFLFVGAAIMLVTGELITSPHFAKPADVLTGGIALLLGYFTYSTCLPRPVFWSLVGATSAACIIAMLLATLPESAGRRRKAVFRFVTNVGRPAIMFGVALASVAIANMAVDSWILWVVLFWLVAMVGRPQWMRFVAEFFLISEAALPRHAFGAVDYRYGDALFVATVRSRRVSSLPQIVGLELATGDWVMCQVGRYIGGKQATRAWLIPQMSGRGFLTLNPQTSSYGLTYGPLQTMGPYFKLPPVMSEGGDGAKKGDNFVDDVVGFVAEATDSTSVRVNLDSNARIWSEGDVLACNIQGEQCLLQIVSVELHVAREEDDFRDPLIAATCIRLGALDPDASTFRPVPWIPAIGTPVGLNASEARQIPDGSFQVGAVQGLNLDVAVVDSDGLVTKNTMVLGALGTGKSTVVRRLVGHLADQDVRVIVIDVTREYQRMLRETRPGTLAPDPTAALQENLAKTESFISTDANGTHQIEGSGNVDVFVKNVRKVLKEFLFEGGAPKVPSAPEIDGAMRILVIDPDALSVTAGEKMGFKVVAQHLSVAEKTRIIAEQVLKFSMRLAAPTDSRARIALVLEEAHLLVPEFTFIAQDGDRDASNGTARVVLQGRKYGLGAIVVAQRTANVSKSVLTQCMTTIALRTMDETGQSFLANQLGIAAAGSLASLPNYFAYVSGIGFGLNAPLRVQLPSADAGRD